MPAVPELGDILRLIWEVEVLREVKAHNQCNTDSHIRVSREVAVYLHSIAEHGHKILEARICLGRGKHDVVILSDIVGQECLLNDTEQNKPKAHPHLTALRHTVGLNLRQEVVCTHDRACNECWEEREEEDILEPRVGRLDATTIYVDNVAYRLEGVERDTYRKDDIEGLEV